MDPLPPPATMGGTTPHAGKGLRRFVELASSCPEDLVLSSKSFRFRPRERCLVLFPAGRGDQHARVQRPCQASDSVGPTGSPKTRRTFSEREPPGG